MSTRLRHYLVPTLLFFFLVPTVLCVAQTSVDVDVPSLSELTERALKLSRLEAPGGAPFRLKAVVSQEGNKNPEYRAEIEEIWVAPDKWRRTIRSASFSQTTMVNGSKVLEQNKGDYYPFWLRNMVTALFDLLPQDFTPHDLKVRTYGDLYPGRGGVVGNVVDVGSVKVHTQTCSGWPEKVGTAPAENSVFSNICFQGQEWLLKGAFTPFFRAEFSDLQEFRNRKVPRLVSMILQQGTTTLQAKVTELSDLRDTDESLFAIEQSTPDKERVYSVRIRQQDALERVINPKPIVWAPVHDGKTEGNFSLVVYADKDGHVRETRLLSTDNAFPQEQARQEIMQWRFKPVERDGVPVQMESLLTFHFSTVTVPGFRVLSDSEGRKMATVKVEPHFTRTDRPKGTPFTVRIIVDEQGKLVSVENAYKIDIGLFNAAESALHLWQFKPRSVNHKRERYTADITFHVD